MFTRVCCKYSLIAPSHESCCSVLSILEHHLLVRSFELSHCSVRVMANDILPLGLGVEGAEVPENNEHINDG